MPKRLKPGKLAWRLIGLVLSISIALYLLREVDLNSFAALAAGVSPWSLLAALLSYLLLNFFRLLRFRALLADLEAPFAVFYPIVLYHNLLVRVLPFKTGEISYVVLLRQHLNQPVRDGVSSLVSSRLFELLLVIAVGGGALLLSAAVTQIAPVLVLLLIGGGSVVYLAALYYSGALLRQMARALRAVGVRLKQPRLAGWGETRVQALAGSFDRMRHPQVFGRALLISVFTYSMSALFYMVLLYAIGLQNNPGLLLGIISIVMLAEALPLATISGLGMIEGGWVFGLVALAGLPLGEAASIGFFLHGCQILAALISGLGGYAWLNLRRRASLTAAFEPRGADVRQS
jgi:uncharacterized membrane protein YbhN (UPF0104 family)